jgi:hypothetical protein
MKTFRIKVVDVDGNPASLEVRAEDAQHARIKACDLLKPQRMVPRTELQVEEVSDFDQGGTEV